MAKRLVKPFYDAVRQLTEREVEALQLAANGHRSRDVARLMGYQTAKSARSLWERAAEKLGADNTIHAVAMAIRRGLIQ